MGLLEVSNIIPNDPVDLLAEFLYTRSYEVWLSCIMFYQIIEYLHIFLRLLLSLWLLFSLRLLFSSDVTDWERAMHFLSMSSFLRNYTTVLECSLANWLISVWISSQYFEFIDDIILLFQRGTASLYTPVSEFIDYFFWQVQDCHTRDAEV